jgi:predicted DCC family thiol-disulfide oxidoreductase YuxK
VSAERVVVFDGFCHVCSGGVRFVMGHPVDPPFEIVPMQSERGRELLVRHGIDPDDPTTFLVLDDGKAMTESDASIHVVAALGGIWRLAAAGRIVPKLVRDWMYRVLARNRYRWFGKRATCYLPPR